MTGIRGRASLSPSLGSQDPRTRTNTQRSLRGGSGKYAKPLFEDNFRRAAIRRLRKVTVSIATPPTPTNDELLTAFNDLIAELQNRGYMEL